MVNCTDAPGASDGMVSFRFVSGSVTSIFVRITLPVLVTMTV